jgi:hypothetical protein
MAPGGGKVRAILRLKKADENHLTHLSLSVISGQHRAGIRGS